MSSERTGPETSVDSLVRAVARAPRVTRVAAPVRLVPGTLIAGNFEILDELGRGGMGIVYRAHDRQLDREVAIKFVRAERWAHLPRATVVERVEREARATARLQHPSIVTLYQAGEHEGALYLVLELLRGQNLASALRRPLPLPAALEVIRAVTDALVHAHGEGVLHRDVKPHNVFLGEGGQVWVLDFGLASLHEAETEPGEAALSRAGTPAYMAPEQRVGAPQDARTDVWALGLLLYQLVTAYEPPPLLAADDLARPPWTSDLARLPAAVAAVVAGAVRWRPEDRYPSAAAFRAALDGIPVDDAPVRRGSRAAWVWPAVAVGTVALAGAAAVWALRDRAATVPAASVRFAIPLPATEPFATLQSPIVAVAPTGDAIVYVGRPGEGEPGAAQLYLRRLDDDQARVIPDTLDAEGPFFSPDGTELGFAKDGSLWRQPLEGGPRVRLAGVQPGFRGGTWTRTGAIVFAPSWFSGLHVVPAAGGEDRPLTTLGPDEKSHRFPHALPDGRAVLFVASGARTASFDEASVEVVELASGARRAITTGGAPRFLPPSTLLVPRAGTLAALRFDPDRRAVIGSPTTVLDGLVTAPSIGVGAYDVDPHGTLAYVAGSPSLFTTKVARVARDGTMTLLPVADRPATSVRVAPDGTLLIRTDAANATIWRHDLTREIDSRLTWTWDADHAVLAPGGEWLYLVITRGAQSEIVRQRADGTGDYQPLWRGVAPANLELSRDGRLLLFDDRDATTAQADVMWLELDRPGPPRVIAGPDHELQPALSPDGRWLAYTSDVSGTDEVYVQRFPEPGLRLQVSSHGGRAARWSPDGRELWFRDGRAVMVAPIELGEQPVAGKPRHLFDVDDVNDPARRSFDLWPDGDGMVTIVRAPDWRPADTLRVVLGWRPEPVAPAAR